MHQYWVYILASKSNGTLYAGVTNNLVRRVCEHKEKKVNGSTEKYHVGKLVYLEEFEDIADAIAREKCIKRWKREWKIQIIEEQNPNWDDLYDSLI